jgi:hypothetical protein
MLPIKNRPLVVIDSEWGYEFSMIATVNKDMRHIPLAISI